MPDQAHAPSRRQVRTELFFTEEEYARIKELSYAHAVRRPTFYSAAICHMLKLSPAERKQIIGEYIAENGEEQE